MIWKWTTIITMMNNNKVNIEGFGTQNETVNQKINAIIQWKKKK